MPKRYLGNIITDTPTAPAGKYEDSVAVGIWNIQEALSFRGASLWPTQGVIAETAFFMGGQNLSNTKVDTIESVNIDTTGTTTDFGTLTEAKSSGVAGGNTTRAVYMGGSGDQAYESTIDYLTYASGGSASSFGNLNAGSSSGNHGQISNNVRSAMITYRSGVGNANHVIEYVNPATTGNGVEWGTLDYTTNLGSTATCSSSVRGLVAGGYNGTTYVNTIYDFDIASGGVSNNFGDLTNSPYGAAGMSSATRGVFAGGGLFSGTYPNTIQYVTIATRGNATDFGDLSFGSRYAATVSGSTIGLYAGGSDASNKYQYIDAITFASTGNATDFGDLSSTAHRSSGASSAMGAVQTPATSSEMAFVNGARQTGDDGYSSSISFYNIATTGNGEQFGEMTSKRSEVSVIGGDTRIIMAGGRDAGAALINTIDYIETSNQGGTASDFGDLTGPTKYQANFGNSTRGILAGGETGGPISNVIQYITIASTGNSVDFGDTTTGIMYCAGFASPTRGMISGGQNSSTTGITNIEYVTIASTGNSASFGDLTLKRYNAGGCSSSTRGLTAGGNTGASDYVNSNVIDYVTIASTGNATDFGDLTGMTGVKIKGASSETRGTFMKTNNNIVYVTIASTGNATDFGDLPHTSGEAHGANSNAHGGLQ